MVHLGMLKQGAYSRAGIVDLRCGPIQHHSATIPTHTIILQAVEATFRLNISLKSYLL